MFGRRNIAFMPSSVTARRASTTAVSTSWADSAAASIILKPLFAMRPSPLTATLGRTITDRRAPRKLGSAALGAGVVVLLAALPLVVDDIYYQHVLIICLVYVVLGQAWNLVGGYAG